MTLTLLHVRFSDYSTLSTSRSFFDTYLKQGLKGGKVCKMCDHKMADNEWDDFVRKVLHDKTETFCTSAHKSAFYVSDEQAFRAIVGRNAQLRQARCRV